MDPNLTAIFAFLSPILVSISISVALGWYLVGQRNVIGARSFGVVLLLEMSWTLGLLFELVSPNLNEKIFWDDLQWIPTALIMLAFLSFAMEYTGRRFKHPRLTWGALCLLPLSILIPVFTNDLHDLAILSPRLLPGEPFSLLTYQFGPVLWPGILLSYCALIWGIGLLVNLASRQRGIYKRQTWIIILGMLIPLISTILSLFNIYAGPQRDDSPYVFILTNVLIAFGLFRYRVFNLVPVARELVIDSMEDGEIVLDRLGRLVEINPAAVALTGLQSPNPVGKPFREIAGDWFQQINLSPEQKSVHLETCIHCSQPEKTLDLRITRLDNRRGMFSGHLLILRDISEQKRAEARLEQANAEMHQQVEERTADLQKELAERIRDEKLLMESEQKYRALFMYSAEAILLLDNGRFITCNEGALHLFAASQDQILGRRPEDLSPEIQSNGEKSVERSARLQALALREGTCRFEWTHRRLDGSQIETEVVLAAILFEGRPVLQATLRDMTLRKRAEEQINQAYEATLEGWARALELRELETAHHSERVVSWTLAVARQMGFGEEECVHLRRGAVLHDIGKMGIPDSILLKPGPLDEREWAIMRQHPVSAYNLLLTIPYLKPALDIPYLHQERWDGSGYPLGLKGEEIPLAARIFAVVDVWDALSWDRPYRKAWPKERVIQYLLDNRSIQFDPQVVEIFLKTLSSGTLETPPGTNEKSVGE